MKQPTIHRSLQAKLLTTYCVLPILSDYLEDIPFEGEIKEAVDHLIALSRDMDDRIFSQGSEEEKRVIADQQWQIQVSFRDWVISNFDLAQKDIKKIPPVQP
jgi:hypothetical protein